MVHGSNLPHPAGAAARQQGAVELVPHLHAAVAAGRGGGRLHRRQHGRPLQERLRPQRRVHAAQGLVHGLRRPQARLPGHALSQVGVLRIHIALHRDDPVLDSDVWRLFGCL